MKETTKGDEVKDILLQEYLRVCSDIQATESYNDRIVGIGFTLLSIGMAVGIAQDVPEVFIILPVALMGILAYAVMTIRWILALGAYKLYLEERVNEIVGSKVLIWESLVLGTDQANASNVLLWIIYLSVSVSIFFVSITSIADNYSLYWAWGMGAFLLLLTGMFLVSVSQLIKAPENMRRRIDRIINE